MSKIGKQVIHIKEGITVSVDDKIINVKGPKGEYVYTVPASLTATLTDGVLKITPKREGDQTVGAMWGLTRANVANIITGVDTGFEKKLELVGVGYRAQMQGVNVSLSLGFSHPVIIKPEPGITLSVAENIITVMGSDKIVVGQTAATIRGVKPPEPYKGKGIKYVGEYIKRKAGKAAKAVGGK